MSQIKLVRTDSQLSQMSRASESMCADDILGTIYLCIYMEPIQNISPQNLSPQNISFQNLSATKLIITKLIKLQNLSNYKTYQNKTYPLQNLSNYRTYQTTKLINKIHESKFSNHRNVSYNFLKIREKIR